MFQSENYVFGFDKNILHKKRNEEFLAEYEKLSRSTELTDLIVQTLLRLETITFFLKDSFSVFSNIFENNADDIKTDQIHSGIHLLKKGLENHSELKEYLYTKHKNATELDHNNLKKDKSVSEDILDKVGNAVKEDIKEESIAGEVDVPDNDYNPGAESVLVKIESDEHVTDHIIQNDDKYELENVDDHYNDDSVPEAKHTKQKSKNGVKHKCDICEVEFSTNKTFLVHMKTHDLKIPYNCDMCKKEFVKLQHLIRHQRTHTGEKPFKCDQCFKEFSHESALKSHLRIHSGEKPFKCDVCAKSFVHRSGWIHHMRIHTGEKPYKCEQCSKCFAQSGQLAYHKRFHTGEKPYKCESCTKEFRDLRSLSVHTLIHTGERPFQCSVCNKGFLHTGHLRTHMRTHTGEKPFKCERCFKEFARGDKLKLHLRTHD